MVFFAFVNLYWAYKKMSYIDRYMDGYRGEHLKLLIKPPHRFGFLVGEKVKSGADRWCYSIKLKRAKPTIIPVYRAADQGSIH